MSSPVRACCGGAGELLRRPARPGSRSARPPAARDALVAGGSPSGSRPAGAPATASVFGNTLDLLGWTRGSVALRDELSFLPWVVGPSPSWASRSPRTRSFVRSRRPARSRRPRSALPRRGSSGSTAATRSPTSSSVATPSTSSRPTGARSSATASSAASRRRRRPDRRPGSVREPVREACTFTESHGLRIAVLGASEASLPLWRDAGLNAIYIGDEAIVETGAVQPRGTRDPQGAAGGDAGRESRLHRRASPRSATSTEHARELEQISTLWRRARRSAASRWRWTRSERGRATASSCSHETAAARSAATSTSSPATVVRRCRCRSCAAIGRRRTA